MSSLALAIGGCRVASKAYDGQAASKKWHATGRNGAVMAGSREAADAGLEMLKSGGNAADAAVASIFVMTVTDSKLLCFGSEVPILFYDAKNGKVVVIAGQGVAPKLATPEFFEKNGGIPDTGLLPAAVPGLLDACLVTLEKYGTMSFTQTAGPWLHVLDTGAEKWHADLAKTVRRLIEAESKSGGDRERGLKLVADYFYRGPIAREIDAWCRANGGLLRYEDFAAHKTHVEEPISVDYRGYQVFKCGPWTQGPMLLQSLRILEGFDLAAMGHNSADYIHTVTEAMKLALADRDTYYADPLWEEVPLDALLSERYADVRRALIDPRAASLEYRPGDPRALAARLDPHDLHCGEPTKPLDTTTCLTADRWGNVVAATPSGWKGVLVGDTGIWLGTRLQSFNNTPGHPNRIAPGKRPRITLTPTLVLKDGKPVLAISIAGGDLQDQVSLQLLLNALEFGMKPRESIPAGRFSTAHHVGSFLQPPPQLGSLTLDPNFSEEVIRTLVARDHVLSQGRAPVGNACVIAIDPKTGHFHAAGDEFAHREAAAY